MTQTSHSKLSALLACALLSAASLRSQENFIGSFAEPVDGGNLDIGNSSFDGVSVAVLTPRWHESEALGTGLGAARWRNMLFAIRGVQGKIVTFNLSMAPAATGIMILDMDSASFNRVQPVWSYDSSNRTWTPFDTVKRLKPKRHAHVGCQVFPANSVADTTGTVQVTTSSARKGDYGWEFSNATPFAQDVVYISINEQYPVNEFYSWMESNILTNPWVHPTKSEVTPNSFLIGYQSGASPSGTDPAFSRTVPDMPLYGFTISDPLQNPKKVVVLVSGQHPYEGQTKASLEGALLWILDPNRPAGQPPTGASSSPWSTCSSTRPANTPASGGATSSTPCGTPTATGTRRSPSPRRITASTPSSSTKTQCAPTSRRLVSARFPMRCSTFTRITATRHPPTTTCSGPTMP